jgi:protein-tyrosine phosphatase
MEPRLVWEGCFNARDLGGLPTADGRVTRHREIVRSDELCHLTPAGWSALYDYGIRTVVDLQEKDSSASDRCARPAGLQTLHFPLEDQSDAEFWDRWGASTGLYATPLYYRPFLERFPQRCVSVVRAIALARPGGVVVHCRVGRDRTGLIAMLVLAAAGVGAEEIAADYERSARSLPALFAARGEEDEGPVVEQILQREGTTAREAMHRALDGFDAARYLRDHGLTEVEAAALERRFVAAPRSKYS